MQVTKQSLPTQGTLVVTFVAKHKGSWDAQPLDDPAFHSMWAQQVQPKATPSRPSLLLQQQQPQLLLDPSMGHMGEQGLSWGGTQGLDAAWGGNGMKVHVVSDGWKLELLQVRVSMLASVMCSQKCVWQGMVISEMHACLVHTKCITTMSKVQCVFDCCIVWYVGLVISTTQACRAIL